MESIQEEIEKLNGADEETRKKAIRNMLKIIKEAWNEGYRYEDVSQMKEMAESAICKLEKSTFKQLLSLMKEDKQYVK
ncbi:MAG: hypothetical protein KAX33_09365, partial [Candidatus Lokiarchaeota archaeon]|nr:hypothetical protein [Candidatus Lokiarchaeota archaeon]